MAQAPVPVEEEPRHHLDLENDRVRIYDVLIPPGEVTLPHTHSHDTVSIVLTKTSTWTETEIGERRESTSEPGRVNSNTEYSRFPRSHRVGNLGPAPYRLVLVEILKPSSPLEGPLIAGESKGFSKVREDENVIAYRMTLPPGETTGRHRFLRPAVLVRLPDGAHEWIEAGSERELQNPVGTGNEVSAIVVVLK